MNKSIHQAKLPRKPRENDKRVNLKISPDVLGKAKSVVNELNIFFDNYENLSLTEHEKAIKGQVKKLSKHTKVPEKLTIKAFTEAALLYFIKNKFDPRFFHDDSIAKEINRLRNHLLGFIVTQENKLIRPFQQDIIGLKNEMTVLKKNVLLGEQTVEETALETQGALIGMAHVLFEVLQIEPSDRPKLEMLLEQKGIEYFEKNKK